MYRTCNFVLPGLAPGSAVSTTIGVANGDGLLPTLPEKCKSFSSSSCEQTQTLSATKEKSTIFIMSCEDIIRCRRQAKALAEQAGFSPWATTMIMTAVSELARNILHHAGSGELEVEVASTPLNGIRISARDEGPGIEDVTIALQERYSSNGGLGLGLPAVQKAMDTLDICTGAGRGTTVVAHKWLPRCGGGATTNLECGNPMTIIQNEGGSSAASSR